MKVYYGPAVANPADPNLFLTGSAKRRLRGGYYAALRYMSEALPDCLKTLCSPTALAARAGCGRPKHEGVRDRRAPVAGLFLITNFIPEVASR